jgi:hypothetical protein
MEKRFFFGYRKFSELRKNLLDLLVHIVKRRKGAGGEGVFYKNFIGRINGRIFFVLHTVKNSRNYRFFHRLQTVGYLRKVKTVHNYFILLFLRIMIFVFA